MQTPNDLPESQPTLPIPGHTITHGEHLYFNTDEGRTEIPARMINEQGEARELPYVFRGMSKGEWNQAKKRGFIQSENRMKMYENEGTFASPHRAIAESFSLGAGFARPRGSVVAKIAVHPDESWYATDQADSEVATRRPIPFGRVLSAIEFHPDVTFQNRSDFRKNFKHLYGDKSMLGDDESPLNE